VYSAPGGYAPAPPKPGPLESRPTVAIWGAVAGGCALGLLLLTIGIYYLRSGDKDIAGAKVPPPVVATTPATPAAAAVSTTPAAALPSVSAAPPVGSSTPTPAVTPASNDAPSLSYRFEPGMRY